jgi:hypothetical protein
MEIDFRPGPSPGRQSQPSAVKSATAASLSGHGHPEPFDHGEASIIVPGVVVEADPNPADLAGEGVVPAVVPG